MDDELKKIVEIAAKNSEETKKDLVEIKKMVKSIRNHFIRDEIYSFVRFLIIVVPLIVGAIYLMPMLNSAMEQYRQLMGLPLEIGNGNIKPEDMQKYVSPDVLKQLESFVQKK